MRSDHRSITLCALALVVAGCTYSVAVRNPGGDAAGSPPTITSAVVVYHPGLSTVATAAIQGSGFGSPRDTPAPALRIGDTIITGASPQVTLWTDSIIFLHLHDVPAADAPVIVTSRRGASAAFFSARYRYDWWPVPPGPNNGCPLAVAVDARGRVFVTQEFYTSFHMLAPPSGAIESYLIPQPPHPPFATLAVRIDCRTQESDLGEDAIVTPDGMVWFAQGGGFYYNGTYQNHSRIVRFNPSTQAFDCWWVPGDNNEAWGLAWDAGRNRMWFSSLADPDSGRPTPTLVSFNPDRITPSCTLDIDHSDLSDQWCPSGVTDDSTCFHEYALPGPPAPLSPGHTAVDRSTGKIWYTTFCLGSPQAIGLLDPTSGSVVTYPLPPTRTNQNPACGVGPWQILQLPDGRVVTTNFFDVQIAVLDPAGNGCTALDAQGQNPCITLFDIPGSDLRVQEVHSAALDDRGRIWVTLSDARRGAPGSASVAYLTRDQREVVRFPPLAPFPSGWAFRYTAANPSLAGIAIGPDGAVWFADYWRKTLCRLLPG